VAVGDVAEAELREEVPDAGPSAGEHAGSGCLGGGTVLSRTRMRTRTSSGSALRRSSKAQAPAPEDSFARVATIPPPLSGMPRSGRNDLGYINRNTVPIPFHFIKITPYYH
jgi:hypothetical protein